MATVTLEDEERLILPYIGFDVSETQNFLTDVFTPRAGILYESRTALRRKPRTSLSYSVRMNPTNTLDIVSTIAHSQREGQNSWFIPFLLEVHSLGSVSLDADGDSIEFNIEGGTLSAATNWLLFEPGGDWYVFTAIDVNADTAGNLQVIFSELTPTPVTGMVTMQNAFIVPLIKGTLAPSVGLNLGQGSTGSLNLEFDPEPGEYDVDEVSPNALGGTDVYLEPWLTSGSGLSLAFSSRQDIADYDIGQFEKQEPWEVGEIAFDFYLQGTTHADLATIRGFVSRRKGQYRQFVTPRYDLPLRLVGSADTLIEETIEVEGARARTSLHVSFVNLLVTVKGGYYLFTALGSSVGNNLQFDFQDGVPLNRLLSEITGVYLLSTARFNTDSVTVSCSRYLVSECQARCVVVGDFVNYLPFYQSFGQLAANQSNKLMANEDNFLMIY